MEDEETALKKQLEQTSDFDERREIRQKLREIRKKKLDALQSDTAASERPRRRERVKREEQTTVVTKTATSDAEKLDSTDPTSRGTKIEVNYSRTVITSGHSENGIGNGDVKCETVVEEEKTVVEQDEPEQQLQDEVENAVQFSVQFNGDNDLKENKQTEDTEEAERPVEHVNEAAGEPDRTEKNSYEDAGDTEEPEEEEEEVVLTPEVVERIEDVDQLEKLLKEVPLNEYELRKAIRMQIRQLRVKKAMNKKIMHHQPKFKSTTPAPRGMRNERHSVDIQDKNELQKLRAELLKEKEEKGTSVVAREEWEEDGKKKITKSVQENTAVEPEGEGTKEVTTRTEKTTEVEETDAGKAKVTTEVKKTTEVHKGAGGTVTVTKTTRTTEVKGPGGGKAPSIDAIFAQRKKDRIMAKRQQQADTKNKRMAFVQQLEAQSPKVEGTKKIQTGNTAVNQLQEWCRRRTKHHEGVEIQNFTTSWANGLAMCALLHYFLPDKIPYETLDPKNRRANWALAFKVAGEEGIEPLLELDDIMAVEVPEPKSLITYVHFIYQHFADKKQKQQQQQA